MVKVPLSVQDVCFSIDDLCLSARFSHMTDNAILHEILRLFFAVSKNDSISVEWRRFLLGYAAGKFPFFAYRVYDIYNWIDGD